MPCKYIFIYICIYNCCRRVRLSLRCFTAKYEAFDMIGEDWDGTRVKGKLKLIVQQISINYITSHSVYINIIICLCEITI